MYTKSALITGYGDFFYSTFYQQWHWIINLLLCLIGSHPGANGSVRTFMLAQHLSWDVKNKFFQRNIRNFSLAQFSKFWSWGWRVCQIALIYFFGALSCFSEVKWIYLVPGTLIYLAYREISIAKTSPACI